MEEKYFEHLYDHYKETNQLRLEAQKRRNISFIWCCALEAFSITFLVQPETAQSIFQNLVKDKLGIETTLGNNTLQTLMWILLAYVVMRYIQDTLYIERQYGYQDRLEKELDKMSCVSLFGREGAWYAKDYPNSLNLIDVFYKILCPILFTAINIYKIVVECRCRSVSTIIDLIIFISITIILWAFFFDIHPKFAKWCEHIPGFKRLSSIIRNFLRMV